METEYIHIKETEHNDSKVTAHIRGILSRFAQGDATHYNDLVGKLNQSEYLSPYDMSLFVTSLKGLSGAVASIDIVGHETLLQAVFGMGEKLNQPRGVEKKEEVLDRVHSALIKITSLVPLAPLRLCPILLRRMPDIFVTEPVMTVYVENMLRIESGPIGEFCGSTMMMAAVDRLVELYLEIRWDDILPNESNKGIFDTELEDMDDDHDFDDGFVLVNQANNFSEKMDSLMVLTCQHIRSCAENGRLLKVFDTLLRNDKRVANDLIDEQFFKQLKDDFDLHGYDIKLLSGQKGVLKKNDVMNFPHSSKATVITKGQLELGMRFPLYDPSRPFIYEGLSKILPSRALA
ncbi:uncharacterized protein LOC113306428 [Papaver somniferum]|uniref:uncharacterized protein LOC113306428 n=1 Tax=Papaver somniferum TaxID=3469 RepID=UPI000E700EE9|nr:uncharacterized protein LOC113306428 [Papaver somniferum]